MQIYEILIFHEYFNLKLYYKVVMANHWLYCVFIVLISYEQCYGRTRYQPPPPPSFNNDFIANEAGMYSRQGVPQRQTGPQQPNVAVTPTNLQTLSITKQPQLPSSTVSTIVAGKAKDVKPLIPNSTVTTPDNKAKDVKPHIPTPSHSTPPSHSLNSGSVKDLVKFYDSRDQVKQHGQQGYPTPTSKKLYSDAVKG